MSTLIKEIKKTHKLNQVKLSKIFGIDQSTLSKIESGTLKITMPIALIMNEKFKISFEKIFKEYNKSTSK